MKKKWVSVIVFILSVVFFCACSAGSGDNSFDPWDSGFGFPTNEEGEYDENYRYDAVEERGFQLQSYEPSVNFSLDRNTATYSYVRRQINDGLRISSDSVRIEEMINYFDYDSYPYPTDGEAVAMTARLADCPWNKSHRLLSVGLRTEKISLGDVPNNLVFLIDVSGSMSGDDRIGLVKETFRLLVEHLRENDVISVVTYANNVNTLFDGYTLTDKTRIMAAIDRLEARGATAGGDGLKRAYEVARKHFIEDGNNRVIIASDGDFNVGVNSKGGVSELISENANKEQSVYLSVFGYGMNNTRDDLLETLARDGNGNYAYIDSLLEAEKAVVTDIDGTLNVVMKNAKASVAFTDSVEKYRLIGYDTKRISIEEWENEKTDTGEIGSGLTVTALFEIQLKDVVADGTEIAVAAVRYQSPQSGENKELSVSAIQGETFSEDAERDLTFISCVAEFGLILRESDYRGTASCASVLERLSGLPLWRDALKNEFYELVTKYANRW